MYIKVYLLKKRCEKFVSPNIHLSIERILVMEGCTQNGYRQSFRIQSEFRFKYTNSLTMANGIKGCYNFIDSSTQRLIKVFNTDE